MQSRCFGWSDLAQQDYSNPCKLFLRVSHLATYPGLTHLYSSRGWASRVRHGLRAGCESQRLGRNAPIIVSSNSPHWLGWLFGYFDKNGQRVGQDQGIGVWDSKCVWYNVIQCRSQSYKILVRHWWTIDDNSDDRNRYSHRVISAMSLLHLASSLLVSENSEPIGLTLEWYSSAATKRTFRDMRECRDTL